MKLKTSKMILLNRKKRRAIAMLNKLRIYCLKRYSSIHSYIMKMESEVEGE